MPKAPVASCVDMTATIVSFAEPLLAEIPPRTEEQARNFFERVIEIWNMWVASAEPWNDSRGIDEVADAIARGKLSDADKYIQRMLAERWLLRFRDDGRLVVDWRVKVEEGAPVFRCVGTEATPELIAIAKGVPN